MTATQDRAELLELLAEFNADAHTLSRRGYVGTQSVEYREVHDAINELLEALGL